MLDALTDRRLQLKPEADSYELKEGASICFKQADKQEGSGKTYTIFRIATARSDQACRILRIHNRNTDEEIGHFDIRYPVARQSFDAVLLRPITSEDLDAGIRLTLETGHSSIEIAPGIERPLDSPHLVSVSQADRNELAEQQLRKASICEIGWMEGCILEGLGALSDFDEAMLAARTSAFFQKFWQLQGLEGGLPVSTLARLDIHNPYVDDALKLWAKHQNEAGIYSEGGRIVAESCLTVAYPMSVIAKLRSDEGMALTALAQLDHCTDALVRNNSIALRCFEDGQQVFNNWARGAGWYLLGHAKTIRELQGWADTSNQLAALEKALDICFKFQRRNGLWGSFIDDPNCIPDTSGSAIIAVAGAIFANLNENISAQLLECAQLALEGLTTYLSTDGLLGGATQHNCGGEELQRGNYRVSHPYALGVYAELKSLLSEPAITP